MDGSPSPHLRQVKMHGHGKAKTLISGLPLRSASKRNQSVPANPADRTNPEEKAVPWTDIGDLNTDPSYLYPGQPSDPECPVPKNDYPSKENQQVYMQWVEKILGIDRRTSKDPSIVLRILQHEQPSKVLMQACTQAPEAE